MTVEKNNVVSPCEMTYVIAPAKAEVAQYERIVTVIVREVQVRDSTSIIFRATGDGEKDAADRDATTIWLDICVIKSSLDTWPSYEFYANASINSYFNKLYEQALDECISIEEPINEQTIAMMRQRIPRYINGTYEVVETIKGVYVKKLK